MLDFSQGSRFEADFALARDETRLVGYCSSIFLGRTRARACELWLCENAEN